MPELKARLGRIVVAYSHGGKLITARDLKADGAMTVLMRYGVQPNLVQTLEGNPALIHGGPFGNIAHGCNSVTATKLGMRLADFTVTEAGFGADLGAEKFLNIKCRKAGLRPDLAVLVATVRALKYHGGIKVPDLGKPNVAALTAGLANLLKHIENLQAFGLPVIVSHQRLCRATHPKNGRSSAKPAPKSGCRWPSRSILPAAAPAPKTSPGWCSKPPPARPTAR